MPNFDLIDIFNGIGAQSEDRVSEDSILYNFALRISSKINVQMMDRIEGG